MQNGNPSRSVLMGYALKKKSGFHQYLMNRNNFKSWWGQWMTLYPPDMNGVSTICLWSPFQQRSNGSQKTGIFFSFPEWLSPVEDYPCCQHQKKFIICILCPWRVPSCCSITQLIQCWSLIAGVQEISKRGRASLTTALGRQESVLDTVERKSVFSCILVPLNGKSWSCHVQL